MTNPSQPSPIPTARLLAALRADGFSALSTTLHHGVRWRMRRVRNRIRAPIRAVRTAREQRRIRRLNEAPTVGVTVDDPQVAVIVTSRDRAELLGLALRSVQLQDFTAWECIVVDDASLDDAVQVAQTFATVDPRFTVLSHDRVRGLSAARNTGIAAARAPFVCLLDDDDLLLAGSLSSRLDALVDQPPDVVGAFCDWVGIEATDRLECFVPRRKRRRLHGIAFADLAAGAPFISSSPLLRIATLRAAGGFDEDLARAEDVDMWLRVTRAGYRFVYSNSVGIGYRRSPGSLVTGSPELQLECMLRILRRADQPLPDGSVESSADRRSLSDAGFELGYAPQLLNYLALIAATDLDRAVEIGCRELSAPFRRRIDLQRYVASLTSSASRRLGRQRPDEVADVRARIVSLLERLVASAPPFRPPSIDAHVAAHQVRERGRRVTTPVLPAAGRAAEFDGAVVLVAEAVYHVDELGPLHDVLAGRGVRTRFMASARHRDSITFAIGHYADEILPYDPDLVTRAAGLVVLNDWGYSSDAVRACNDAGVPTFAKVEGVQDFEDHDTGRQRNAYRTAAVILGQGQNDSDGLPDREVRSVGSSRLERIWHAPPASPGRHALVNLNFTYGVLADQRQAWLQSVEEAARRAGIEAIVSRHPAERRTTSTLPVTSKPFRYEVSRAGVLVSRFSTVPFEAMARGVPFVYHNPHGERVPTFAEPRGAFLVGRSADELATALTTALAWQADYRDRAEKFFRRQVDIDDLRPSEERAADVIIEELSRAN